MWLCVPASAEQCHTCRKRRCLQEGLVVKQALSALSSPKESGNKRHLLQKESAGLGLALMLTIPFLFFFNQNTQLSGFGGP